LRSGITLAELSMPVSFWGVPKGEKKCLKLERFERRSGLKGTEGRENKKAVGLGYIRVGGRKVFVRRRERDFQRLGKIGENGLLIHRESRVGAVGLISKEFEARDYASLSRETFERRGSTKPYWDARKKRLVCGKRRNASVTKG